jgi:AcrR family transcriptional regulator
MENKDNVARLERNPEATRKRILEAAFMEIYRKGFQGMRLDDVLKLTELTKGALYHHFPNKRALGYAVVDEVILPIMDEMWLEPLKKSADPMQRLIDVVEQMPEMKPPEMIEYGCPLNNLAQEMSPLDEGFRQRLNYVFRLWHDVTEEALERAKHQGRIRDTVDCDETATFIMAALEGCIGIAKNGQSIERLRSCNRGLVDYLESLRA